MLRDELFRWSLVFQDKAGTNIKKYIAQYSRAVLYDHTSNDDKGLSAAKISEHIKKDFDINFHYEEIISSISIYGKKHGISVFENLFYLDKEERECLRKKFITQETTKFYVEQFNIKFNLQIDITQTVELINRFIYYVFEKNKNYFISIDENKKIVYSSDIDDFSCTGTERKLINSFLEWDDHGKNQFLYRVITTSFNYGLITLKKKSQLTIFKGKNFFLDANVIIPLSGIGNEARKQSIQAFYDKCVQNGISLCITEETMFELSNLISKKTQLLKHYANNGKPIERTDEDIYKMGSLEDFYDYYYIWSKKNNYQDLKKFQEDLKSAIFSVVSKLKSVNYSKKEYLKNDEYNEMSTSLCEFKRDANRNPSQSSITTDVLNLLHVKLSRNNKEFQNNFYDVDDYIVSLDNNFRRWSSNYSPFIPLVMHPLDWLTLLYKYSGRTENDYEAFCKFLVINDDNSSLDFEQVLISIDELTTDDTIKRKLVQNIASIVREDSSISEIDLKDKTSKAFDQIVKDLDEKHKNELAAKDKDIEEKVNKAASELLAARLDIFAAKKINYKMKIFDLMEKNKNKITNCISAVIFFILIVVSFINENIRLLVEDITKNVVLSHLIVYLGVVLVGFFSRLITKYILNFLQIKKENIRTKIYTKQRKKLADLYYDPEVAKSLLD